MPIKVNTARIRDDEGAIVTFTKALSELAAAQGVRVNAVAPAPVWTPLIPSTMPGEKVKQFGKSEKFERPAQPAELAPAYVFLAAAQDSSYVTGSALDLTGGRMLPQRNTGNSEDREGWCS
jgi:NAD(P)-dependent dehydrogenase (short-subunit alcohol dehydrogenase family)